MTVANSSPLTPPPIAQPIVLYGVACGFRFSKNPIHSTFEAIGPRRLAGG